MVATVRELLGFIRAVVREVTPYQQRVAEVGRARCTGVLHGRLGPARYNVIGFGAMPVLLLHYHEIWLKGGNRNFFIRKLKQAIEQSLSDLPLQSVRHQDNRIVVRLGEANAKPDLALEEAISRIRKIPGVAYFAVAREIEPVKASILETGSRLMAGLDFHTYRVRVKRSAKSLPFGSQEIARELGARIGEDAVAAGREVRVDLGNAEATCYVEVTPNRALLFTEKIPGAGGLPPATAGRLVCLLSGGFDSAVAAYKIIKRGVRLTFVHFHGDPSRPGEESSPIARELVRVLTPYQGVSHLYLVPFSDLQREVVAAAPQEFRILIYRRLMLRIAERIAFRRRAHGTVTGDAIAQVASQTLQNMEAVDAAASMPIYRPLVGDDKQDILALAKEIGTYDISTEPFTDCCPMFMPKSPRIFSTVAEVNEAESNLDISEMVKRGTRGARREIYEYAGGEVRERISAPETNIASAKSAPVAG